MTDDIVRQARTWLPGGSAEGDLWELVQAAADEIERLTKQLDYLAGTVEVQAAEIEELRTSIPQLIRNERERCAKIAMSYEPSCADDDMGQSTAIFIAAAIRGTDSHE